MKKATSSSSVDDSKSSASTNSGSSKPKAPRPTSLNLTGVDLSSLKFVNAAKVASPTASPKAKTAPTLQHPLPTKDVAGPLKAGDLDKFFAPTTPPVSITAMFVRSGNAMRSPELKDVTGTALARIPEDDGDSNRPS